MNGRTSINNMCGCWLLDRDFALFLLFFVVWILDCFVLIVR